MDQNQAQAQSLEAVQTDIAEVNLTPAITETSTFQAVLNEIPMQVGVANKLLDGYRTNPTEFLENVDDEELDAALKQMQHVSSFVRKIDASKKAIKSYFNEKRDTVIQQLDQRLNDASFDKLEAATADIKQLKKDVVADRCAKRWEEIRSTFEANVNRYSLIGEYAPELADFSRFKLLFPKLVSGAKTKKIKESDHAFVNETLYSWNTAIELMRENEWKLAVHDLNQLLTLFKQNPSIELVRREGRQIKLNAEAREKARIEAEARRIEAEKQAKIREEQRQKELAEIQKREEQARIARDKAAQEQAERERLALEERSRILAQQERERQAQYAQFGGQYKTIFKESFPNFIEYLFKNPNYHDVHTNPKTKAALLYDIMKQVDYDNSVVTLETARDPQKIIDLVRYVIDA